MTPFQDPDAPAPFDHCPTCGVDVTVLRDQIAALTSRCEHLVHALQRSRDIGAAMGILMALHRVTRDDAFELLRRRSQETNTKLPTIALHVIETGALPER
ncbi:ANTAR domain-containing protein [Terrabacter sp. NPDC000476]|jgi:AmiR/NasT family two-component response regulator|uniref:ANTAR domain-containing protein n=1 Tax=Terrabacter sp. NPDC000476 TaxID=3154258 RepID=UPI00331ACE58